MGACVTTIGVLKKYLEDLEDDWSLGLSTYRHGDHLEAVTVRDHREISVHQKHLSKVMAVVLETIRNEEGDAQLSDELKTRNYCFADQKHKDGVLGGSIDIVNPGNNRYGLKLIYLPTDQTGNHGYYHLYIQVIDSLDGTLQKRIEAQRLEENIKVGIEFLTWNTVNTAVDEVIRQSAGLIPRPDNGWISIEHQLLSLENLDIRLDSIEETTKFLSRLGEIYYRDNGFEGKISYEKENEKLKLEVLNTGVSIVGEGVNNARGKWWIGVEITGARCNRVIELRRQPIEKKVEQFVVQELETINVETKYDIQALVQRFLKYLSHGLVIENDYTENELVEYIGQYLIWKLASERTK